MKTNTRIKLKKNALLPKPIAISMGDPAGIGPELCLMLMNKCAKKSEANSTKPAPLILGDWEILQKVASKTGLPAPIKRYSRIPTKLSEPAVLDLPKGLNSASIRPGKDQAECGKAAAYFIRKAVAGFKERQFSAILTAPISKKSLNMAGINYPGHTEMLADLCNKDKTAPPGNAREPVMLLYSPGLAVTFATTHQSLRSVPDSLTMPKIERAAILLNRFLKKVRRTKRPRIAILAMNPHAGEGGLFGNEETLLVKPAVKRLLSLGINVEGPLPADTAFTPKALDRYDGHVALYHDQGGIPFKMHAFETGVNVTLGIDLIRTSPDHGTAFDIAWKGKASGESFFNAFDLASTLGLLT